MNSDRGEPKSLSEWEQRLKSVPDRAIFTGEEIAGLPEPVQRHFRAAIQTGSPLTRAVRLKMRGSIKLGTWLPFRATQILDPHEGFIWTARVAGIVVGSDHYLEGVGGMDWKLAGLFTVASAAGPDVSRSAAGRGGAEAVWVPTALLPRFGARWSATDDSRISVHHTIGDTPVDVNYNVHPDGRIRSLLFDRWGDPGNSGTFNWHPFGGEITGYRTFAGLTIPSSGRLGWNFGTGRWPEGEFFRYEIIELQAL